MFKTNLTTLPAVILLAGLCYAGPALAIDPVPGQLGYEQVVNFGTPGAVWCFEPQKNTCSFITINSAPVKGNPHYDVTELWDEDTILTVSTKGVLRGDGMICEYGTEHLDTSVVTDLDGNVLGDARQQEVRDELHQIWAGYEDVEHCYAYTSDENERPGWFVQHQFENGEPTDFVVSFIIDYAADAREHYRLRPLSNE